jgi:hypothetical protein
MPDQGVDESRPSECKGSGRGDDFLVHSDTVGSLNIRDPALFRGVSEL